MDKKEFAKRYLASITLLYVIGTAVLFALLLAVVKSGKTASAWSPQRLLLFSMLYSLLPAASYSGFCNAFQNVETFSKTMQIMLAVFFPVTLVLITAYGLVMIVPSIVKNIIILLKKD